MTWRSFLSHLECTACSLRHDADVPQTVCTACGKVLFARYDLDGVRAAIRPGGLAGRRWDLWRYCELLPVRDSRNVISLGEGMTPLLSVRNAAATTVGLERGELLIKD
jgi:threonine synthase